ncbi:sulfatase domain-containing protein [Sarocladium implicatum]|nr:sulfatase domain-containing protein [Sarocladium implicatum]
MSDDQDATMDSISYMPRLKEHIIDQGTYFANHFTTTAICCPSRVSLWTGRQPHNTNVTDVDPPYGGFPKFISQGLNDAYLPVWLQDAGYSTYYTGKMFNSHTVDNYDSRHLAGWTSSRFLLDPGTYSYLNPIFQKDHDPPVHHRNEHTTQLIQTYAAELISKAVGSDKPFFVALAPIAPHSNIDSNDGGPPVMTDPIPLPRHAHLFPSAKVPRTSNFNPESASGVSWIAQLPRLNESSVDKLDAFYRQRLRALQGVDELVEQVILQLDQAGVLDDTYIIYTSDNGYHLGQHRLPPGKECGFEEDIRVPFFIRGPRVPKGATEYAVTAHIDVAPTIHEIARMELRDDFDGMPLPLEPRDPETDHSSTREHVAVEYWGSAIAEGEVGGFDGDGQIIMPNNTYKAIRLKSDTHNLYYSVWCSNEHELYDLSVDPHQMDNLYHQNQGSDVSLRNMISRLDSLMMVMKSCKGLTCRQPWSVLHPDGRVRTLEEALDHEFDDFYEAQAKVSFSQCELGYIVSSEGPQSGYQYRGALGWSEWT